MSQFYRAIDTVVQVLYCLMLIPSQTLLDELLSEWNIEELSSLV